jgi:tRNA modification GTPase
MDKLYYVSPSPYCMITTDPICALATPNGAAGLAVVRLSGNGAFALADQCFRGKTALANAQSHTIHYGIFWTRSSPQGHTPHEIMLDTVVASVFRAPNSYTGEDVVEIGCHGGIIVSNEVVKALISEGARHAEPGEFTKRAFLNQKMDLTQVEAVGDLIHAASTPGSHAAARQLTGGLTAKLDGLREQLLKLCGLLELELDFSHEDIELVSKAELISAIEKARGYCLALAESHRSSEILRSGYCVSIVGYPNAGKSSLLNALLERTRAIVSNTPGTTRDYIEEMVHWGGMAIKLIDTAGFRASDDTIEIEGIRLAESLLQQCDLILVLNDRTLGDDHSVPLLSDLCAKFPTAECVLVHNKIDALAAALSTPNAAAHTLSAQTGVGVEPLKTWIADRAVAHTQGISDALINARQASLLAQTATSLQAATDAVINGVSNEFVAIDLREALKRIGEITGAVWNEDILNAIFSKFCIGK